MLSPPPVANLPFSPFWKSAEYMGELDSCQLIINGVAFILGELGGGQAPLELWEPEAVPAKWHKFYYWVWISSMVCSSYFGLNQMRSFEGRLLSS